MQGQIDGNVVQAKFTLSQRQKSPPPKPVVTAPKRDTVKTDGINADKDGPKRLREGIIWFVYIFRTLIYMDFG